ncbi:hypothetical protein LP419_22210 [Massilia sp. H-1]|nr:hypothetical protein LP419_22210 [Massilia sp. H-1]
MVNIMNMNHVAVQYMQMCSATDVQARAYTAATGNWRKRNAVGCRAAEASADGSDVAH